MKDIIKPIIVLASICLVVTAMLAYVNYLTDPVIIRAEEEAAAEARCEVLSKAKDFEKLDIDGLPDGVTEVYKGSADNKLCGYVILMQSKGYGGLIKLICGIAPDGRIESVKTLSHSETSGLGTKAVDNGSGYREKFAGKTAQSYNDVDTVTGATISSTAYKKAIGLAFEAFGMIKEAEHENA